ncbi:MAG: dihydrodipicolinate synthase family protein [Anaerolineae bacterium]|nr:dihydrodipicolinate synthase family protein [Anaerolineae bacterium]
MAQELRGIIPPLTTPFTQSGDVYEKGLRELIEFQISGGSEGLFICGTYGSGPVMTLAERKQVHEITVDQVKGRIAVVAHVGTTSTSESIELAQHAQSAKCDYVAAVPPYYYGHDHRTVLEFFRALVASVDLPVYVYNNPKTSGVTVTGALLRQLEGVGVAGIKDSGFSYVDFTHLVLAMDDKPDFRFIVGTEGIALPAWMAGAKGCISGLANAFPELMAKHWNLFKTGQYEEAARMQLRVNRARQILHIPSSTNAACYAALEARGVDVGYPKAPVLPVLPEKRDAMIAAYKDMGLL